MIRREEAEVVAEHAEFVLLDLGVGRVKVGRVDLSAGEGAIGEVVVETADVAVREPVAVSDAGPAVGPIHEFIAESEFQVGISFEVGQRDYAETRGDVLAHADGIGVVEPERPAHSHAPLGQRRSQGGLAADALAREDFAR